MRPYQFAGREWVMNPLTLRQKKLIAGTEASLREAFLLTARAQLNSDPSEQLQALYDAGCKVDQIVLSDDFTAFLATILVEKGKAWEPGLRKSNAPLMEEIPVDVQAEVLRDFFSWQMSGMRKRTDSSPGSNDEAPQSTESATPEDLPDPTTSS